MADVAGAISFLGGLTGGSQSSLLGAMPTIRPIAPQYVFDVRDYGARGDGATDDSTAIQAAIDAAAVSGGVVRFPRATYQLVTGLAVAANDVTLQFDHATLRTSAGIEMLRLGEAPASSAATWKRIHVTGQLVLDGAGNGVTACYGLVLRNCSYCTVEGLRITDVGGTGLLVDSYGRGTQYNTIRNVDLEGNWNGTYILIRSQAAGGYTNDNLFESIRSHDNEEGTLIHARLIGGAGSDGVNENAFHRTAIKSLTAGDTLLSLEGDNSGGAATGLVQANLFMGLRLDGTSGGGGTNTLAIDADSPGNIFMGVTFDGAAPTDASGSSFVIANRGSANDPYIRLGHAGTGGTDGYELIVQTNSSTRELTVLPSDGTGAARFPAGMRILVGDPDGGDVAPVEIDDDQLLLRTLASELISAGPRIKFEGQFSGSGDQGNATLTQIAAGAAGAILELAGQLKLTSLAGGLVINEDGDAVDFRVESLNNINAIFLDAATDLLYLDDTRFTGSVTSTATTDTSAAAAVTIDWTAGNYHAIVLTESTTFTFTAPAGPAHLTLKITQNGTGTWVPTFPTLGWGDSIKPRWSTAANAVDLLFLFFDGTSYHASAMVNSTQV